MMVVIAGCQFLPQQTTGPEFYTGTEGLEIQLMPHNQQVFELMPFQLQYRLRNKGVHNVVMYNGNKPSAPTEGLVTIQTEPRYITVLNQKSDPDFFTQNPYQLLGKSRELPAGSEARVFYELQATETLKSEGVSKRATPILLRACYPYKTTATTEVCIDTDPFNENPAKPCMAGVELLKGGQGAPVAVTSVETRMTRDGEGNYKPYFDILLENVGGGQVLNKQYIRDFCKGALGTIDTQLFNLADVTVRLKGVEMDCGEDNTIRIDPLEPTMLRCKPTKEHTYTKADGTFNTFIEIEIDYGYTTTASTNVDIVSLS
ncbi:hypothetical protein KY329_02850 [Candidatus Woesearchaeota archaeon]|nr:hypothetical protein [Candidatus Woesearchaeota archaeon]